MPFTSGWMGETHFAPVPTASFGFVLFMAGVAYYILEQCLITLHGKDSLLAKAVGGDSKGIMSVVLYGFAIGLAFVEGWISLCLYAVVAIMWLIPDRRIERKVAEEIK